MSTYFTNIAIRKAFAIEEASNLDTEYTEINVDDTSTILHLERVNTIIDRINKERIFTEVLSSLNNKTGCERAAQTWDSDFWVSLPLSWNSVIELLNEVKFYCKKFKTNIPDSWNNLVDYDIAPENQETQEFTSARIPPNV